MIHARANVQICGLETIVVCIAYGKYIVLIFNDTIKMMESRNSASTNVYIYEEQI